jgi:hypothetical protein
MRKLARLSLAALATIGIPAAARAADGWGIDKEKVVQLEVTVVDIACALGKECPQQCGGGKRQLGVLTAEGKLYPAVKGGTLFAGAVADLLPFCGRKVQVDGLLIENTAMQLFFVQSLRETADQKWQPAEAFEKQWTAANGKAEEWFRADPVVKRTIAEDGVFGIKGLEPKK